MRRRGAQDLLEVRHRFLVGSGRPSVLMLIRSAAARATMTWLMMFTYVMTYVVYSPEMQDSSESRPLHCN